MFIKQLQINFFLQKLKTYIDNNNNYNVLAAPCYSRVGKSCMNGEAETLQINTPKNAP